MEKIPAKSAIERELEFILDNNLMNDPNNQVKVTARMRFKEIWAVCFNETLPVGFWE